MPDAPPRQPGIALRPLPPEEAIAYFRSKGYRVTWRWAEMWEEDHVKAFTVAKATRLDILQDIREALDEALAEGTTLQRFQKDLTPILQAKGWWGERVVDGERVRLGSPRRLRTIFRVNTQTAYQAGHYRAMTDPDVVRERPYWRYVAVMDARTRPQHAAWHGTVLPADDLWWGTHYPPNGWNCRCTVVSLSPGELRRDGLSVSRRPPARTYEWVDRTTGEVLEVPVGIDPGWAYNPGQAAVAWEARTTAAPIRPNQPTWRDVGRPDLRDVATSQRLAAPAVLEPGATRDEAVDIVARALGIAEGQRVITVPTRDGDLAVLHRDRLAHLVEKRGEQRERYAAYIRPTLEDPYEIWLTDFEDGLRKQYVGLFTGARDLLVVIRLGRDGGVLWNIMQAEDRLMNRHRVGALLYGK